MFMFLGLVFFLHNTIQFIVCPNKFCRGEGYENQGIVRFHAKDLEEDRTLYQLPVLLKCTVPLPAMRVLHISEQDETLFGSEFNKDLFKYFVQHRDAFQQMWKEQGPGFWLRFVISLRSFMKTRRPFVVNVEGNEVLKKRIVIGCDEAYCKILDDLTASSCSAVKTLVMNVAAIAEEMNDFGNILRKSGAAATFFNNISQTTVRELFGDSASKETLIMIPDKMVIYCHATGSLCVLLKRWIAADERVTHVRNIPWNPPASWDDVFVINAFEIHLHRHFGEDIFDLVGVSINYNWVAKMECAETELKKMLVDKVSNGVREVLPWKSLDREWTEKKLASPDICLHVTKLVWSTYWLSLSENIPKWFVTGNIFNANHHEMCTVQISVAMYHYLFSPNFFTSLFKQLDLLKTQLDDETLSELERYTLIGKKCGPSKTKWNDIIQTHQVLEKMIPIFRNRTNDIISFIGNSKFRSCPTLDKDVYIMIAAWHLPMARDYLDHVLYWISCFEEFVAPLTIFPILKELQQPLERILIDFRLRKFLAQVCFMYVDELDRLYGTGDFDWLRAAEYHETIQDLLSKLWLQDWQNTSMRNLQKILRLAWSKQELKDGITSNPNRQRIFAKFSNLGSHPSVETLFCDNPRHLAYWVPMMPELDKRNNNFEKVQVIWKEFRSKMEKGKLSNWNEKVEEWDSFNKELTDEEEIMFERMNWHPASVQESVDNVKEALVMIREDGNVDDEIFSKMNEWLKSLILLSGSKESSPVLEIMLNNLKFLHKHGCLYLLGKSAYSALEKFYSPEKAIFVSLLFQQCTEQITVSSSKFVCLTQIIVKANEKFVARPSERWYHKITSLINNFLTTTPTGNLKLAGSLWEKLCTQFRDEWKNSDSTGNSDDGCDDNIFDKWQNLVKKVVRNCYRLSATYRQQGGAVAQKQFPHWHTLLFFMREEIGYYLGISFNYADLYCDIDSNEELFKKTLMNYRLSWMEKEVEEWCADSSLNKRKQQLSSLPVDSAGLLHQHAVARVRILFSDIIIKSCVSTAVGLKINTFVSTRNVTVDLLNEWSFFMLNLVANDTAFWTDLSVLMVNFTAFLEIFADYTDTYRDHMIGLGGINYEKWELDKPWEPDTVEHYRIVILALLRFNLINFYLLITKELPLLVNLHMDRFIHIFNCIMKFFLLLTSDKLVSYMKPEAMDQVKSKLLATWQETKNLQPATKKDVQILSRLPRFVVGDDSWKALLENYVNGRCDAVATKLALVSKSTSNQHHPAAKNVNKNKKKQTPVKLESKVEVKKSEMENEVTVPVVQWDDSVKDLVMKRVVVGCTLDKLPEEGEGCSGAEAPRGSGAPRKGKQPSSPAGSVSSKGVESTGKETEKKEKPAKQKCDPANEKNTVACKAASVPNGEDARTVSFAPDNVDDSVTQNKSSVKVKALRNCAYCNSVEPSSRVYMKCALCKEHNFRPPMFYCGQDCHAKHWEDGHGELHAAFSKAK